MISGSINDLKSMKQYVIMHTEVEFRFKVDPAAAKGFLSGMRFLKEERQKDVYLDTADGMLFRMGVFLRERNGGTVDFKFNLEDPENRHEHCEEHSFALPFGQHDAERFSGVCARLGLAMPSRFHLDEFKKINGLGDFVIIDKNRRKYHDGEFTFCLDDVSGFGTFLEIESMARESVDLDALKRRMIWRVSDLRPEFLPTGYIELFVKQKDPELYKKGKYLLKVDRAKVCR